jgi:hypothetical protein
VSSSASEAPAPRILFVCLAAYRVASEDGLDPDGRDRQEMYAVALEWLLKTAPQECAFLVADNTVDATAELIPPLQAALSHPRVIDVLLVRENTLGVVNKGAGEHEMCRALLAAHQSLFDAAEWIVYYTSRHVLSFPLIFELIAAHPECEAIVGNPSYLFTDGSELPSAAGNLCDMLFAMKAPWFVRFVENMRPDTLVAQSMNSEAFLHDFVAEHQLSNPNVERFGVLRYDVVMGRMELI